MSNGIYDYADDVKKILAEKDQQIAELQKQLEEKEKDNQFLKKMYLSERTKNDNYHTEKYGLDKPVEELRKIKLNPKEKKIYYKGFDNCERQFATHIAELQQQLEEKDKEIEILKAKLETAEYWNKKYDDCQQQLALTEKALKLAREYMFNVMCADDVPFESWFIECAKNDWKPS